MPKYDVSATLTITTEIEPQGHISEPYGDEIEEFQLGPFNSYGHTIEDSCEVTFTLITEATDEDDASSEAEDLLNQLSYEGDDIEWEITDVSIDSIERQSMGLGEAVQTLRDWITSREEAFAQHHPAVAEAIEVVLQQF